MSRRPAPFDRNAFFWEDDFDYTDGPLEDVGGWIASPNFDAPLEVIGHDATLPATGEDGSIVEDPLALLQLADSWQIEVTLQLPAVGVSAIYAYIALYSHGLTFLNCLISAGPGETAPGYAGVYVADLASSAITIASTPFSRSTPHNLIFTFDGTDLYLTIDGIPKGTIAGFYTIPFEGAQFEIGAYTDDAPINILFQSVSILQP
jgi:hypothetical protein